MNAQESNRLIAEFMGLIINPNPWRDDWIMTKKTHEDEVWKISDYHRSWDWLMSVVDKIENEIGHAVKICQKDASIFEHDSNSNLNELLQETGENKRKAVYKVVVEFIKWYNEQKS